MLEMRVLPVGRATPDVVLKTWVFVPLIAAYFGMGAGAEETVLTKRMAAAMKAVDVYISSVLTSKRRMIR